MPDAHMETHEALAAHAVEHEREHRRLWRVAAVFAAANVVTWAGIAGVVIGLTLG